MTDKLGKFVVVKAEFWHLDFNDEVEAVAAAFEHMSHSRNVRLLHVVQEIDLDKWTTCSYCGGVAEKGIGCWRTTPCIEAQCAAGVET